MTFLPIVERELRVAARVTATYRNRMLSAAAVAAVAVVMLLVGTFSPFPLQMGPHMFSTLSWLMLIFCLLEGGWKTADCISAERRDGTLGLLFLTDLKGYDVILGKLAGNSLSSVYGLFAILPILALSLLLGGVTQGEFWRMALALINVLFFSLCAGLWVSAHSRVERQATTGTVCVIALCLGAPLAIGATTIFPLSPGYAFYAAPEVLYRTRADGYWQSFWLTQLLCWILLVWASLAVPRVKLEQEMVANRSPWRERWRVWQYGDAARRARLRTELLWINPALWLAARNLGTRLSLWILLGLVVCGGALISAAAGPSFAGALLAFFYLINLVVKMRFASMACHCLAEAKANNALEMLLCTPLKVEEMIAGQVMALRRVFLLPVTLILVAEALVLIVTEMLSLLSPALWSGWGEQAE